MNIKRPGVLIIRDGWGANPYPEWNRANAVHLGRTPVAQRLMAEYPHVQIVTSGEAVGLPAGVMGNSEVGHQNLGAGRVVDQEIMRITRSVRDESFFKKDVLVASIAAAKQTGGRVHVMGLCSDAGVHSKLDHAYAVLEACKRADLPADRVLFHAFGDGRDSPPESGIRFIANVQSAIDRIGVGRVATVIGRFYAMDRDNRWDRVEKAYRLLVFGDGHRVGSPAEAFQRYYDNPTDASRHGDEFIEATVVLDGDGNPPPTIRDGDAVVFFNFRGDRPRELVKAFVLDKFPFDGKDKDGTVREQGFDRGKKLDIYFATMTEYEKGLPVHVIFVKPEKMPDILGEYISALGLKQFRIAETEKFPHVTFFFNDYREEPFEGESRFVAPSPRDVPTYDLKPEMSALQVTDAFLAQLERDEFDLAILNFANGDMVGHTGVLEAAIRAVETVDECVGRVVDAVLARGGCAIVTADHGNCEQMVDPETGGPHTAHTTYDVELIVVDDDLKGRKLRTGGALCDVAPTLLEMMHIDAPAAMTGRSLLQEK